MLQVTFGNSVRVDLDLMRWLKCLGSVEAKTNKQKCMCCYCCCFAAACERHSHSQAYK